VFKQKFDRYGRTVLDAVVFFSLDNQLHEEMRTPGRDKAGFLALGRTNFVPSCV